jgi:ascorbate-specific PTS system EIIC-type component UlaA
MTMFDNINIDPVIIEFVISYVIPAVIGFVIAGLGLLKLTREVKSLRDAWRGVYPLFDEETDPAIIVAAMLLRMTSKQLVESLKKIDDAIDPKEAARLIIDSINSQRAPAQEVAKRRMQAVSSSHPEPVDLNEATPGG